MCKGRVPNSYQESAFAQRYPGTGRLACMDRLFCWHNLWTQWTGRGYGRSLMSKSTNFATTPFRVLHSESQDSCGECASYWYSSTLCLQFEHEQPFWQNWNSSPCDSNHFQKDQLVSCQSPWTSIDQTESRMKNGFGDHTHNRKYTRTNHCQTFQKDPHVQ